MLKTADQQGTDVDQPAWLRAVSANANGSEAADAGDFGDRQRRHSKRVISDTVAIIDLVVLLVGSVGAKLAWVEFYRQGTNVDSIYFLTSIVGSLCALLLMRNQGLYQFERLRLMRRQFGRVLVCMLLTMLILTGIGFFLRISPDISRGWVLLWVGTSLIGILGVRLVASRLIRRWTHLGLFRRRIAIYGSSDLADRLNQHLQAMGDWVKVQGMFDDNRQADGPRGHIKGGLDDLMRLGAANKVDEIILALPTDETRRLTGLIDELSVLPVDIRVCPDLFAFRMRAHGIVDYEGVSVIEVERRPLDDWGPILKAIEDRVIGVLALLAAAPVMGLIALAIKLDSKGPVFFRQRRHGFNHEVFHVMKFRTMFVAEDGPKIQQASRHDPRITRVGRFLRRTSLDELPQLINVVRGEMSIVGPRPHAIAHNEYYGSLLERYANRHKMKPGITGWAQVNGFRGETETPDKMRQRIEFDLHYIENWSLWLDLKILIMTPIYGFVHKNAF